MDKLKKLLPYVLVVVLLIMNYQIIGRLDELTFSLNDAKREIINTKEYINNIHHTIKEDLDEDNIIENTSYQIENLDTSYVMVNYTVDLKAISAGDQVFLYYKEQSPLDAYQDISISFEEEISLREAKIALTVDQGLTYKGSFRANKMLSYDLKVLVVNEKETKVFYLDELNLFRANYPMVEIDSYFSSVSVMGAIEYKVDLKVWKKEKQEAISLRSAKCKVYLDDIVLDDIDLLIDEKVDAYHEYYVDSYELTNKINAKANEKVEDQYDQLTMDVLQGLTIEIILETDQGITYKKHWHQDFH